MPIALGSDDSSVRLGVVTPSAVYLGQTLVWPSAQTLTLYYFAADDNDWSNLLNWFQDAAGTVPASSLPTASDDVVLFADVIDLIGPAPATVNNLTMLDPSNDGYALDIPVTVLGVATFNGSSALLNQITGNAVFNDNSENAGTVNGNAVFNDTSVDTGTVTGTITDNR